MTNSNSSPSGGDRVIIIGCGNVGATSAYALLLSGVAREIVLIDNDAARAEGEAMDLQHAVTLSRPVHVRAGSRDSPCFPPAPAVITAMAASAASS